MNGDVGSVARVGEIKEWTTDSQVANHCAISREIIRVPWFQNLKINQFRSR